MTAEQWNQFIVEHNGSFLHSWEWGEFQQAYGRPVERLLYDHLAAQVIVYSLPANRTYLFSPYGPVGLLDSNSAQKLVEDIQLLAKKHKAIFWRYERGGTELGGQSATEVHPHHTITMRLEDPAKMLATMKSKCRYNIRLAERKGVVVRRSTALQDIDSIYELFSATALRQSIRAHPKSYYQLMLDRMGPTGMVQLYLAEYQDKVIAANLMIGFGSTMTYVHGGSNNDYRKVMAPHFLQWIALKDAYEAGYQKYDFFGVAPENEPDHPWAGITRFKEGFGGDRIEFAGTYELALNAVWYNSYNIAKHLIKR